MQRIGKRWIFPCFYNNFMRRNLNITNHRFIMTFSRPLWHAGARWWKIWNFVAALCSHSVETDAKHIALECHFIFSFHYRSSLSFCIDRSIDPWYTSISFLPEHIRKGWLSFNRVDSLQFYSVPSSFGIFTSFVFHFPCIRCSMLLLFCSSLRLLCWVLRLVVESMHL